MQEEGEKIMLEEDYYRRLNVGKKASAEEITNEYRRLFYVFHPDKYGSNPIKQKWAEQIFNRVKQAYEVLSDAHRRAIYDASVKLEALVLERKVKVREERYYDSDSDSDEGYCGYIPKWKTILFNASACNDVAYNISGRAVPSTSSQGYTSGEPAATLQGSSADKEGSYKRKLNQN